jgi:hypothetical protein
MTEYYAIEGAVMPTRLETTGFYLPVRLIWI